jgi:hypothetical protein
MSGVPRSCLTPIQQPVREQSPQSLINKSGSELRTGVLHVVGFVVIVAVLGAMSEKHSASYVFTGFSNTSGWDNDGASWLVGLLSTVYPFLGYDFLIFLQCAAR